MKKSRAHRPDVRIELVLRVDDVNAASTKVNFVHQISSWKHAAEILFYAWQRLRNTARVS